MIIRRIRRTLVLHLILLLSALLLAGCQMASAKSERVNEDWSRGERLGQAVINDRVALATDATGENIYVAWVREYEPNEAEFLHFAHLDGAGRILSNRDLGIGTDRPAQVEIAVDHQDHVHLTWVDRLAGVRQLFYARLTGNGDLASYARPISLAEVTVESYATGVRPAGGVDVFWGVKEGEGTGLYHTRVGTWGDVIAENRHLGPNGFDPMFRTDGEGALHLVWQEEPSYWEHVIYYAIFDNEKRILGVPATLASFPAQTGVAVHRPALGLAGEEAYVFWSLERRGGGFSQPSAGSYHVTFPLGRPESPGKPRRVHVPDVNHPRYAETHGFFNAHALASQVESPFPSRFVYMPWTTQGHGDELAVVFALQVSGRTRSTIQTALTVWSRGDMKGYQIVGKTRSSSLRPRLVADSEKDLHLIWIDTAGFGAFDVYYASTTQEAREWLNRITGEDIAAALFDLGWGIVQALSFIPLALAWMFVPLALIALYVFVRAEGSLSRQGPRIVLVVAVLLYSVFKYLFRPNWLAALPLPHGLAPDVANVMIYIAPLVISALACTITWWFIRRRESISVLAAFGVFAVSDALITLLIYVPGVLAE